ncbi:MAG: hypothetical protein M3Z24_02770 [Chloroflexota bacterium]|nr:hypothetical protein [Chloroflexota bacterium]
MFVPLNGGMGVPPPVEVGVLLGVVLPPNSHPATNTALTGKHFLERGE